jgi:opacity protein-like surface antigen
MKRILSAAGLLAVLFSTSAQAEDLVFTLTNGTSSVLTHFYTSPVGVDSWEGDVFGDHVLEPGASVQLTIADGRTQCEYDMRFEFEESSDLDTTEDSQNLCELGSYTIHE